MTRYDIINNVYNTLVTAVNDTQKLMDDTPVYELSDPASIPYIELSCQRGILLSMLDEWVSNTPDDFADKKDYENTQRDAEQFFRDQR